MLVEILLFNLDILVNNAGVELIKKLRQSPRTGNLPVIVLTGFYRGEKFQAAAKALGVRHYLEKPVKTNELVAAIQQIFSTKATSPVEPVGESRPFAQHLRTAFLKNFSGLLTLHYPDTTRLLTFIK